MKTADFRKQACDLRMIRSIQTQKVEPHRCRWVALLVFPSLLVGVSCSGGQGDFDGGGVRNLPENLTDASGTTLDANVKPTDADGSGNKKVDSEPIEAGKVSIGTEITGVNLSTYEGALEVDGKPLANAEVIIEGTNCRGKTNEKGRFSITCPTQATSGILTVTAIVAGQERMFTFDADGFLVGEAKDTPSVASLPLLHSFTNLVIGRLAPALYVEGSGAFQDDKAFWSGMDDMPLGSSFPSAIKASLSGESVALIHNVSHNHEQGLSLGSDCNQLMSVLQSVERTQPVTLSYDAGLLSSSLGFRRGSAEQSLALPDSGALSWVCGTAFDSKRETFWASSFGGAGLLLSVQDELTPVTIQAEFVGSDLGEMAYLSKSDQLIGVDPVASANSESPAISMLRKAELKDFPLLPPGVTQQPSKLTVIEDALVPAIPLCFRDSNIQLHDGYDSALLHVTDNISVQRLEAQSTTASAATAGGEGATAKHRIYKIRSDGTTELLFSNDARVKNGDVSLPSDYCARLF